VKGSCQPQRRVNHAVVGISGEEGSQGSSTLFFIERASDSSGDFGDDDRIQIDQDPEKRPLGGGDRDPAMTGRGIGAAV